MKKRFLKLVGIFSFAAVFLCVSIQVDARPLTIAILSDVHYATNAVDKKNKRLASAKKILPSVLDKVNHDPKIDLVVFTGDMLVNPLRTDLQEFHDLLAKHMKKPYLVVPGNHDLATIPQKLSAKTKNYHAKDFIAAYKGHPYEADSKKRYWSVDFENWHLVGLDTPMPYTWGGHLSDKQLHWLKKDLKKNVHEPTIIFAHHGLTRFYPEYVAIDPRNFIDNLRQLQKVLKKFPQVKVVVTGHMHMPIIEEKNGITYFSAPTIVTYPNRYAIMTIDEDSFAEKSYPVFSGKTLQEAKEGLLAEDFWHELPLTEDQFIGLYDRFKSYHRFGSATD